MQTSIYMINFMRSSASTGLFHMPRHTGHVSLYSAAFATQNDILGALQNLAASEPAAAAAIHAYMLGFAVRIQQHGLLCERAFSLLVALNLRLR